MSFRKSVFISSGPLKKHLIKTTHLKPSQSPNTSAQKLEHMGIYLQKKRGIKGKKEKGIQFRDSTLVWVSISWIVKCDETCAIGVEFLSRKVDLGGVCFLINV